MQRTADFHDQIADACLPQAVRLVHNATALHAAVDVLDADAPTRDASIRRFLRPCELPSSRLLCRHDHLDLWECKRQKPQILEQPAARGQGIGGRLGNPLIMGTAGVGVTDKEDHERRIDQQHVVHGMALFLAAITACLLSRILGARDAPLGPVVTKRGEAGAGIAAGGPVGVEGSAVGMTRAAVLASATPRRRANSCTHRVGASPKARSVARSTTRRT
jgi:hypothetical protein